MKNHPSLMLLAVLAVAWLAASAAPARAATFQLGRSGVVMAPSPGTNSVILVVNPATTAWTATANTSWLHLSPAYQGGTGGTNVIFTCDANPGTTRAGTLTIAGLTLSVTQAGSNFIAAGLSIVVPSVDASGLAVDGAGNLYVVTATVYSNNTVVTGYQFQWQNELYDYYYSILKFAPAGGVITTVVSPSATMPAGSVPDQPWLNGAITVDSAGNVYFVSGDYEAGSYQNEAVYEWSVSGKTISTLIPQATVDFRVPDGLAFDSGGNLYISDEINEAVYERTTAGVVSTLMTTTGNNPEAVAVDAATNVYVSYNESVVERAAVSGTLNEPVSVSGDNALGVSVDGGGNLFSIFSGEQNIVEWSAANNVITYKGFAGLNVGLGPIVSDSADNVYVSDPFDECVKELPRAFVDPTPKFESLSAGSDVLSAVAPATANLTGPLAPVTDQPWLTINGVAGGVVSFSFTANNTGAGRTGHIILLGQPISVTQAAAPTLAATARWEGPAAGADSVILVANPYSGPWTATANATWLHVNPANTNGVSSTNVIFNFDANPTAATRVGTLTLGGQTLNVTQAGSNYVAVSDVINLVSAGLSYPEGVTLDPSGDVYIADSSHQAIKEWVAGSQTLNTIIPEGTVNDFNPEGVALDGAGNLYIAEGGSYGYSEPSVYEYPAATKTLALLPVTENSGEQAVAVDAAGNLYIASERGAIYEYTAASDPVTILAFSGLVQTNFGVVTAYDAAGYNDTGVAVDAAGNVYITAANSSPGAYKWSGANNLLLYIPVNNLPAGVTVDGAGNAYFIGDFNIQKLTVASNSVTTFYTSTNSLAYDDIAGVALDTWNNLYFTATEEGQIRELRLGFVDPLPRMEPAPAGNDSLPPVLPAPESLTGPFAPASDSSWLTINSVISGVINFSFTANTTGAGRTAHITVLGESIPVVQTVPGPTLSALVLTNGDFKITFTGSTTNTYTVLDTTNLALPLANWTVLGTATGNGSGSFQFTGPAVTSHQQQYFTITAP